MKKILLLTFALVGLVLAGCSTSQYLAIMGPPTGYGTRGSSDPHYGYEGFPWGTRLETIRKETGWDITGKGSNYFIGSYEQGWGNSYHEVFIPHGGKPYVNKTWLHFTDKNRLYAAEDEYKETPTLQFLHRRYGEFPEENLAGTDQKNEGIEAIYRRQKYLNITDFYTALEIIIYADGKTLVKMREPFFLKSISEGEFPNVWICYSSLQKESSETRINFTFVNQNKDGKCLFIGYSKGYEQPNISFVRAGVCWGDKADGSYDIKGDGSMLSKNYSTEKWSCAFNGEEYVYTNAAGESARNFLDLLLASERVIVRHDSVTTEFASSGKQLLEKIEEYDITKQELEAALANEEF